MNRSITRLKSKNDFKLSPHTGWTRNHWVEICEMLLSGIPKYADPAGGLIRYPGQPSWFGRHSDAMEGFSRAMILSSIHLASGGRSSIDVDGKKFDIPRFFREGLVAGTDPGHKNYWGDMRDPEIPGTSLRALTVLECGSMAWSMYLAREQLWDPLSVAQKKQIMDWMLLTNERRTWGNNWLYFQVFVNTVAKKLGFSYSESKIEDNLPPYLAGMLLLYKVKSLMASGLKAEKKPNKCEVL